MTNWIPSETEAIPVIRTIKELNQALNANYCGVARVLLTQDVVKFLLSLNERNRSIKKERVDKYYRTFKTTGYHVYRAFMTITNTRRLVDGQHRLLALERVYNLLEDSSFSPPLQFIGFGEPDECLLEIDNGAIRSASDTCGMLTGEKRKAVWSAITLLLKMRYSRSVVPEEDILRTYEHEFKDFCNKARFLVPKCTGESGGRSWPAWVILAFKLAYDEFGATIYDKACDQFYTGKSLEQPFVVLRLMLANHRGKWDSGKNNWDYLMGFVFSAFNKFIRGESVPSGRLHSAKLDKSLKKKLAQYAVLETSSDETSNDNSDLDDGFVIYGRYRFRNKLEAQWAYFFDQIGVKYFYQAENADDTYTPDFFLPKEKIWVEIKNTSDTITTTAKYEDYGQKVAAYDRFFICVGLPNTGFAFNQKAKATRSGILGYAYNADRILFEPEELDSDDVATVDKGILVVPSTKFSLEAWQPGTVSLSQLQKAARATAKIEFNYNE